MIRCQGETRKRLIRNEERAENESTATTMQTFFPFIFFEWIVMLDQRHFRRWSMCATVAGHQLLAHSFAFVRTDYRHRFWPRSRRRSGKVKRLQHSEDTHFPLCFRWCSFKPIMSITSITKRINLDTLIITLVLRNEVKGKDLSRSLSFAVVCTILILLLWAWAAAIVFSFIPMRSHRSILLATYIRRHRHHLLCGNIHVAALIKVSIHSKMWNSEKCSFSLDAHKLFFSLRLLCVREINAAV